MVFSHALTYYLVYLPYFARYQVPDRLPGIQQWYIAINRVYAAFVLVRIPRTWYCTYTKKNKTAKTEYENVWLLQQHL